MTKEEKILLLQDLCGRLPYKVKGLHREQVHTVTNIEPNSINPIIKVDGYDYWFPIEMFKPYLRSMSSMTEDEREEYRKLGGVMGYDSEHDTWAMCAFAPEAYDWLNKKMFDYRGLIPKGLALETPVEPKFKVGDCVVYNRNDSSREILYVYDIRDGRYYFNDNIHLSWSVKECDEKCHLWTIEDAKDGDVLANEVGAIFINAGISKEGGTFNCYCYLSVQNEFCIEEHKTGSWFYKDDIKPATKEQCDILFQKMKEAGYEWDTEKKELKNIEQKPTERSSPYGKNETAEKLIALAECLEMDGDCLFNGLSGNDYGKFLRALSIELTQPKQEWSEEDESMLTRCIGILGKCYMGELPTKVEEELEWLKSLKPNHWKPSKQNIKDLEWCADLVKDKMGVGFHRLQVFIDELKSL